MKKLMAVGVILLGALVLTGCDAEKYVDPNDKRYYACLKAGGSFEVNGSISYWQCVVPGAPTEGSVTKE